MLGNFTKFKATALSVMLLMGLSLTASAQQGTTLVSPDGQTVPLSGLHGKVVVLMFGGVQDPQCRDEFKALQSLADRYKNKDVKIFWVSINSPADLSNEKLKNPCGPTGSVIALRDQNQAAFK